MSAGVAVKSARSPSVKVGMAAAAVAVVVVVALGLRWWTQPTIFGDLGDSGAAGPRPVADAALSTTVIFPKADGELETVTLEAVDAVFSENTAEAKATFWICHLGTDETPIGAVNDPGQSCQDIVPFEPGASFRHGVAPDSDYLFLTIAPTTAGVAHLVRVEVKYARGAAHLYQRGTESIDVNRQVRAT